MKTRQIIFLSIISMLIPVSAKKTDNYVNDKDVIKKKSLKIVEGKKKSDVMCNQNWLLSKSVLVSVGLGVVAIAASAYSGGNALDGETAGSLVPAADAAGFSGVQAGLDSNSMGWSNVLLGGAAVGLTGLMIYKYVTAKKLEQFKSPVNNRNEINNIDLKKDEFKPLTNSAGGAESLGNNQTGPTDAVVPVGQDNKGADSDQLGETGGGGGQGSQDQNNIVVEPVKEKNLQLPEAVNGKAKVQTMVNLKEVQLLPVFKHLALTNLKSGSSQVLIPSGPTQDYLIQYQGAMNRSILSNLTKLRELEHSNQIAVKINEKPTSTGFLKQFSLHKVGSIGFTSQAAIELILKGNYLDNQKGQLAIEPENKNPQNPIVEQSLEEKPGSFFQKKIEGSSSY